MKLICSKSPIRVFYDANNSVIIFNSRKMSFGTHRVFTKKVHEDCWGICWDILVFQVFCEHQFQTFGWGYTRDCFLAPATQRVKFHRIAVTSDKNARVSCPARQRNCNLISSATLPKS